MVYDAGCLTDMANQTSSCQRACSQGRGTSWGRHDFDCINYWSDLGTTDVGHLVGLGSPSDLFFDLISVLPRISGHVAENPDTAADLTSVLCIVGSVFAVLSRYAVNFWSQGLHQGASLSLDKEKNVADVFYQPLLFAIAGFVLLFFALVLLGTRSEIRLRRAAALRMRRGIE